MKPLMQDLADQLNCNLLTYKFISNKKINKISEVHSVSLTSLIKLLPLIKYFNKYKLLGNKYDDFKD
jgi:LAGLIDADG endonuclease